MTQPQAHTDLLSTLHNTLEASAACERGVQDAAQVNDAELEGFFRELHEQYRSIAERAKSLLAYRLAHDGHPTNSMEKRVEEGTLSGSNDPEHDSIEDIGSKESFPASDPPGTY